MAKGNGGTRGGGQQTVPTPPIREAYAAPSSGGYIPVTDRGMNGRQRAVITAFEAKRRNNKIEYGMTVDKDGNIVKERKGTKRRVQWGSWDEIPKDGILTHIHPIDARYGNNMGRFYPSVGKSFSGADISVAIQGDLSEIRAVTPNYTFSMRRPKSGWNVAPSDFMRDYNSTRRRVMKDLMNYASKATTRKESDERFGRLNILVEDRTMRELSRRYNFIYTRSRRIK